MPNYSKHLAPAEEPPYLQVGTDVSAKYKGAFCEAKITDVNKHVKLRVLFDGCNGTYLIEDSDLKAGSPLETGTKIEAKHPEKNKQTYSQATITKILDHSRYTVVFDDGDQCVLRRNSLCLKSGKHFAESETLDQLPLTNPEHFGNPVKVGAIEHLNNSAQASSNKTQNNNSTSNNNNHNLLSERQKGKATSSSSNSSEDTKPNVNNVESNNNYHNRKRQSSTNYQNQDNANDKIKKFKKDRASNATGSAAASTANATSTTVNATTTISLSTTNASVTPTSGKRGPIKGRKRRDSVNNGVKNQPSELDDNSTDSVADSGDANLLESNVKFDQIEVGVKLMVQYGKGKVQNVYEAKVSRIETSSVGRIRYFVHYTGWNNRYDEWITRNRIVSIVNEKENGPRDGRTRQSETTANAVPPTGPSISTTSNSSTKEKVKEEKDTQTKSRRSKQIDVSQATTSTAANINANTAASKVSSLSSAVSNLTPTTAASSASTTTKSTISSSSSSSSSTSSSSSHISTASPSTKDKDKERVELPSKTRRSRLAADLITSSAAAKSESAVPISNSALTMDSIATVTATTGKESSANIAQPTTDTMPLSNHKQSSDSVADTKEKVQSIKESRSKYSEPIAENPTTQTTPSSTAVSEPVKEKEKELPTKTRRARQTESFMATAAANNSAAKTSSSSASASSQSNSTASTSITSKSEAATTGATIVSAAITSSSSGSSSSSSSSSSSASSSSSTTSLSSSRDRDKEAPSKTRRTRQAAEASTNSSKSIPVSVENESNIEPATKNKNSSSITTASIAASDSKSTSNSISAQNNLIKAAICVAATGRFSTSSPPQVPQQPSATASTTTTTPADVNMLAAPSLRTIYKFCEEIDESDCDKKISILQERIMALRQTYISLKTDLADLDRRRKRPRTDRSNSDHINNCNSSTSSSSVACRN